MPLELLSVQRVHLLTVLRPRADRTLQLLRIKRHHAVLQLRRVPVLQPRAPRPLQLPSKRHHAVLHHAPPAGVSVGVSRHGHEQCMSSSTCMCTGMGVHWHKSTYLLRVPVRMLRPWASRALQQLLLPSKCHHALLHRAP